MKTMSRRGAVVRKFVRIFCGGMISLFWAAGAAYAEPVAGVGVYGGAVTAYQPGISSYGLGGGVDIQYPINEEWSLNPFIFVSVEHATASHYDLLDGLAGVQLRRWFDSSWYVGGSLASHNTTYHIPGNGTANAASLIAPGVFVGTEFHNGYGIHFQVNYEPAFNPNVTYGGNSPAANRFSGLVFLNYRWAENENCAVSQSQGESPVGSILKLSDMLSVGASGDTSVLVGVSYSQRTYKSHGQGAIPFAYETTLTDNGSPTPVLEVIGKERPLADWPLKAGRFVIGWDWTATLGIIDTHDQVINNGIHGQNVGTGVNGYFVGMAPMLFFKAGPLSPSNPIFAKISLGVGPGAIDAHGTGMFGSTIADAGTGGARIGLYRYAKAELERGHWNYAFTGSGLTTYSGGRPSVQTYGFSVAYKIPL